MNKEKKITVSVYCTHDEYIQLKLQAESATRSISNYIISLIKKDQKGK